MTQMRKQIVIVLTAIAMFVGALVWKEMGIGTAAIRHQTLRVSAVLGAPIIVILSIRGWITVVTDQMKVDAPQLYARVQNFGAILFLALAMSSGFVTGLFELQPG
jgi:hypothetical protein